MRVLIAEDVAPSRHLLKTLLSKWGYEVEIACNGREAWQALQHPDAPRLAILDWMMPEMEGVEVCRHVRMQQERAYVYIILLTAKSQKAEIVTGLEAGADDYMTKPFEAVELRARVQTGARILALEDALKQKIAELEEARAHVEQLQGLLPICMHCKQVRDGSDRWQQLEAYLEKRSQVLFSHGLCDACLATYYPTEEGQER